MHTFKFFFLSVALVFLRFIGLIDGISWFIVLPVALLFLIPLLCCLFYDWTYTYYLFSRWFYPCDYKSDRSFLDYKLDVQVGLIEANRILNGK